MFKPMLAQAIEDVKEDLVFPKLVSTKLDGIRCITRFGDVLSRSLKRIPNHSVREKLTPYQGLDGELISGSPTDPKVYSKTFSAVMTEAGVTDFTYYVFDYVDCHQGLSLEARQDMLKHIRLPDYIKILPQAIVNSQQELTDTYIKFLEQGYEGVIVRNINSPYKYGRATAKSQDMLKVKPFADGEAKIISTYEAMHNGNEAFTNELGRTARTTHQDNLEGLGMLGGFIVEDVKTGVQFNCAPGMLTHKERTSLWQSLPSALTGKIVRYRSLTIGVKDKPRHPRFIGWRDPSDM